MGMGPNTHAAAGPAERDAGDEEFIRAENEDDDGYDPYSDRRPQEEPLFERFVLMLVHVPFPP